MTEKIKSFFRKKKTDAKFMHAGKGYKLNDTSSSTSAIKGQPSKPIKRAEPTIEAKTAGQAALARLEAEKNDIKRFNTSYAAIQARVKRELEQEKKEREEREKHNTSKLTEVIKENVERNELLTVTDVFFRCPYISDEILTRNDWRQKIKEFLYEQLLEGEEVGLTACLIIQNCNTGKEKIQNCVETLGKYLENILNNPGVEKYRKIRMCNKIFQEKVLPLEGTLEFLQAAGFRRKKLLHNDEEEEFLVWDQNNCNIDDLNMLLEALRSAEVIPLELDRNLQVLLPKQASEMNELAADFFTLSLEELKKEQQLRTEAFERNQMLRTKAMREKDEQRELRKYRFTLIRVKFPDSIILQGTFSVHEIFRNVVDFVKDNLIDTEMSFSLVLPTGQSLTEDSFDKTLLDLKLVPACMLIFSRDSVTQNQSSAPQGYLREDVLCLVQNG